MYGSFRFNCRGHTVSAVTRTGVAVLAGSAFSITTACWTAAAIFRAFVAVFVSLAELVPTDRLTFATVGGAIFTRFGNSPLVVAGLVTTYWRAGSAISFTTAAILRCFTHFVTAFGAAVAIGIGIALVITGVNWLTFSTLVCFVVVDVTVGLRFTHTKSVHVMANETFLAIETTSVITIGRKAGLPLRCYIGCAAKEHQHAT